MKCFLNEAIHQGVDRQSHNGMSTSYTNDSNTAKTRQQQHLKALWQGWQRSRFRHLDSNPLAIFANSYLLTTKTMSKLKKTTGLEWPF